MSVAVIDCWCRSQRRARPACFASSRRDHATHGDVQLRPQRQRRLLRQEHDNLQGDASLLDNIRAAVPNDIVLTETQLRGMLGMMA